MLSLALNLVFLVVGAVLGAWASLYIKRPKLTPTSGGGGGGATNRPGYWTNHVGIENKPGLIGINFGETVIFGKGLHFEKGVTVERDPAREIIASIYDKETGERITHLWWRSVDNPGTVRASVKVINSAETWDLMLFARLNSEPLRYFIYQSANGEFGNIVVPDDEVKFRDTKRFVVRVNYNYGRRKLEFDITVRKGYDGRFHLEGKYAGGGL
jgi:hypothetical protein